MKEKDVKFFKDLLTRWLDDLLLHAGSTVNGLRESDEALPDPLDRAVFDSERNFTLRIRGPRKHADPQDPRIAG